MSTPRRFLPPVLFCAVNGVLMVVLALFWLGLPRTFGDEAIFIKWTSLVKKTVLGIDPKPPAESFLYVDVSRSKALVEVRDPLFEEYTGLNHTTITDREQLARFLDAVATYGRDVPLVILDINFAVTSPADSALQTALDTFPYPLVGASDLRLALNDSLRPLRLTTGVAMYLSVDENFMKYPLYFADTLPTLPLAALHAARGTTYGPAAWGSRLGAHRSLTNPIVDFKVRPHDLEVTKQYSVFPLGSLLLQLSFWDEADITKLFRGKTIVVGDFVNDFHQTVFGSMPGPMIVHNAYLTLWEGETIIHFRWLLLLFAIFAYMSWRVWREVTSGHRSWLWHRSRTALGKLFADSIDDTFYLVVATVLSYLLFNIHVNILVLLIYLKAVTWLLRRLLPVPPAAVSEEVPADAETLPPS